MMKYKKTVTFVTVFLQCCERVYKRIAKTRRDRLRNGGACN